MPQSLSFSAMSTPSAPYINIMLDPPGATIIAVPLRLFSGGANTVRHGLSRGPSPCDIGTLPSSQSGMLTVEASLEPDDFPSAANRLPVIASVARIVRVILLQSLTRWDGSQGRGGDGPRSQSALESEIPCEPADWFVSSSASGWGPVC